MPVDSLPGVLSNALWCARLPGRQPCPRVAWQLLTMGTEPVRTALAGIDTVFMVSAAETPHRVQQHVTFIDAAVEAGVGRIVYVSFFGASPTATFTLARDHWATEEHLRSAGVAYTILRDNIYADFTPHFIGTDGNIRGPAGDGRAAVVGQTDIADVAAAVLSGDGAYDGRTLNLTGPEALTMYQIAAILSDHLGRTVSYIPETIDEAYASRAVYGAPPWQWTPGLALIPRSLPASWPELARTSQR